MRGWIGRLGLPFTVLVLVAATAAAALAWTPLPVKEDPLVFVPGTQPDDVQPFEDPGGCEPCHSRYNPAVEPGSTWRGSMMAQAARDPLWLACLTVAAQDSIWALGNPNATDICIRCHSPQGWLEGASDPTNTAQLAGAHLDGVACDFCHRSIDPFAALGQPDVPPDTGAAADLARATQTRTIADLGALTLFSGLPFLDAGSSLPTHYGAFPGYAEMGAGGFFTSESGGAKYGPRADARAPHQVMYSRLHASREFCHSCHDVSNPVLQNLTVAAGTSTAAAASYFHVERTQSEFLLSAYGADGGADTPGIPGVGVAASCQDCHMRDVAGAAARMSAVRGDLKLHDLTGGSAWVAGILATADKGYAGYDAYNYAILSGAKHPGAAVDVAGLQGDGDELARGKQRAVEQVKMAATLSEVSDTGATVTLRVTNNTGHKLLSGFPEGRRMFLSVTWYDAAGSVVAEVNRYRPLVMTPGATDAYVSGGEIDSATKDGDLVWEAHMTSSLTGEQKTFHFALADGRYEDDRIPPKGFRVAGAATRKVEPVDDGESDLDRFTPAEYAGGYDEVTLTKPAGAARYVATLYYQTTTKDYIEFLRDEIQGTSEPTLGSPTPSGESRAYVAQTDPFFAGLKGWGSAIWDLWVHNGGAAPLEMAVLGAAPEPPTPLVVRPPKDVKAAYNARAKAVKVSWAAPATGANGYLVYRAKKSGGPYVQIGTTAKTLLVDSKVRAGTTYFYRVKSYKVDKLDARYVSAFSSTTRVRTR